ncbi:hypothetical protein H6F50_09005 [Coleofasciculus sp. FACHB-712]|uniref:plasmid replication protein, CyRepA1 family n=1 Tax=Coleofasciculus sp. FACHB-712 TaxID=2692789 RepID=UPI00168620C4|nr:plasmid replication protein, CyRepA1 family [Coleofasciculus sp. FACHB-712]MBD1942491.1 hypothetical protein [Coleofasciculus sp. FACHB-712]
MTSFKGLKGSCPVCSGARKDCRQNTTNNLIHCRDSEASPVGYRLVGEDAHGFSMWAESARENESDWQARQERVEQKRQRREEEEARRNQQQLSVEERDRLTRPLLKQLYLHDDQRQNLRDRGLTDAAIDAGMFRTIKPLQCVEASLKLFGVDFKGRHLAVVSRSILCPIWDTKGRVIGWQNRLDNPEEGGKYRWPSFKEKTVHLQNGELPITCCRPVGRKGDIDRTSINLAEGFLKPFVAAQRLKQVFVGAAGGNFSSSEQQLRQYLEELSAELETKLITLSPDAGAVQNPQVMGQYRKTWELCRSWGYEVRVGWWGQVTKDSLDIDELEDASAIAFISPEQLWDIFLQEQQRKREEKEAAQRAIEQANWVKLTALTRVPWRVVNTPDLNLDDLPGGAVYVVKSAKGTGKTNALKPLTQLHNDAYALFARVALGREECERIGIAWHSDLTGGITGGLKAGFCIDSAHQFNPSRLKNKSLLIVDEALHVLTHMFGDTCNKGGKRPLILTALQAMIGATIAGGGKAIAMDADANDLICDYLEQLAPKGTPLRVIRNDYQPEGYSISFLDSDTPDAVVDELLIALEAGQPCFVIDDCKNGVRGCKSIAEYVRRVHPECANQIVEINSDTSGDPGIIGYLKNINQASKNTLLLCCSPSVVSGISIQNDRFQKVFGVFNGILTDADAAQALGRVRRKDVERIVWASNEGLITVGDGSIFPEDLKAYYQRNYQANCKHILGFGVGYNPITDEWDSPHFDLYCKLSAYRNASMKDLRRRLEERLRAENNNVTVIAVMSGDDTKAGLKESWQRIEIAHAQAVASATVLSDEQLKTLEESNKLLTPQEKLDVEKTWLLKNYGQPLIDAIQHELEDGTVLRGYQAMCLKDDRGRYKAKLDNFYLLTADESVAIAKDVKAAQRQQEHGRGVCPQDLRIHTRRRRCRQFLGLDKFLKLGEEWTPQDFWAMAQKARANAPHVKDALNLTIPTDPKQSTGGWVFELLMEQIGLDLKKRWATRVEGQKRFKYRQIEATSWHYAQLYVQHQISQVAAQEEAVEVSQPTPNWITPPSTSIYESRGGVIQFQTPGTITTPNTQLLDTVEQLSQPLAQETDSYQTPQTTNEGSEAGDTQSLVGRVLRVVRGFGKGTTDWVVSQSGNFLKTAQGWHIALGEIGNWYEWTVIN